MVFKRVVKTETDLEKVFAECVESGCFLPGISGKYAGKLQSRFMHYCSENNLPYMWVYRTGKDNYTLWFELDPFKHRSLPEKDLKSGHFRYVHDDSMTEGVSLEVALGISKLLADSYRLRQ